MASAILYLNEGYAVHSEWRPDAVLTGGEWDMFLTVPPLLGRPSSGWPCWATPAAPRAGPSACTTPTRTTTGWRSTQR